MLPTTLPAFFWHFIKKQPVAFTIFFIAPASLAFESTVQPYALKLIIDIMTAYPKDRSGIFTALMPALLLYSLSWIAMEIIIRSQNWLQGRVIPKFQRDIRMSAIEYLTSHSHHYFSNQLTGSLANKVSDLPRAIESIRMMLCWNIIAPATIILASLIMMATVSPVYSLILGTWATIHILITRHFATSINSASKINAEDKSRLSGVIVDSLVNITSVKLFARKKSELQHIMEAQLQENASMRNVILKLCLLRLWMDVLMIAMMAVMLTVLIIGWEHHRVSTGDIAFIVYGASGVMYHMWSLGEALANMFNEIGIARQALSIITAPHDMLDKPDASALQVSGGEITFDRVSFHYVRNQNVFTEKTLTIHAGEKVGLVGFSGSGKTTFVNLILRFFDVESGRILIDRQDIAEVTQDSLRSAIAMIPQDTSLFHRSLMENIRYGRQEATDEEVIEASKKAHCDEFISALSEGYHTLVGERGIKLSGGQRQRIAIARAILKNAPILILDEATSALDSMTEHYIKESLQELMTGRTTIVIAHRLSTLADMDRILVFDKGHIVEEGTHEELLARNGHYSLLWSMQAGGFLSE